MPVILARDEVLMGLASRRDRLALLLCFERESRRHATLEIA